jgi:hypothetical protein
MKRYSILRHMLCAVFGWHTHRRIICSDRMCGMVLYQCCVCGKEWWEYV